MKKIIALLIIALMMVSLFNISVLTAKTSPTTNLNKSPGEIITVFCSDPSPTLGTPLDIIVTVSGKAMSRFNETVTILDDFCGLVSAGGNITWDSGNVTVTQTVIHIGWLPTYTKKIAWYPSVAGNHSLFISAGAFPMTRVKVSVGFDVEGIVSPSIGSPALIIKNNTNEFPVVISEERNSTDEPAQILGVDLISFDGTVHHPLTSLIRTWSTWLPAGSSTVEDELIAWFDISGVPDGFYTISVTTTQRNYSWPHAVKIISDEPTEYTVVQLSDIHIGKYGNFFNKKAELTRLIAYINDRIDPDFIIMSGDSVDWYNTKAIRNVYADLQEVLLTSNAPVFTVPGNHERYGHSLLLLYSPFTNLTSYHRFLSPLSDYSFQYGGMNFIFLDSGHEYSRLEISRQIWNTTPEGSGLTTAQMYLLESTWGDGHMNQIISMHHPAVNDKNDTNFGAVPNTLPSGNDECIAYNRGEFIQYCQDENVSVVLTGHTHKNHVFTAFGKETDEYSAWPLFIQTMSATLSGENNGGRLLHIKNGAVLSYDYVPFT